MRMVFIADAHLKGLGDPNQAALVEFLDSIDSGTLVVLGDLFDFWAGSNFVAFREYAPALEAFERLKKRGVKIMYFEGNHDFSMGPFFTEKLSARVFDRLAELEIGKKKLLIGHGDTVAMSFGYRLWRAYLRSPLFRLTASVVGSKGVWAIAGKLSKKSRKAAYLSSENFVEKRLREFAGGRIGEGADFVALGHSHEPGVSALESAGRKGVYANPGSWARDKSYLVFDGRSFGVRKWSEDGRN